MTHAELRPGNAGIIVGAGPAGRALASALAREGVASICVDPRAHDPWRTTWGLWDDEAARHGLTDVVAAGSDAPRVRFSANEQVALPRGYRVLDPERLRAHLSAGLHLERARVTDVAPDAVRLADGTALRAPFVIDARGPRRTNCAQTAVGRVVRARDVPTYLMDFALDFDDDDARPTFGYVVPLDGERVLVEETALAASPPMEERVLQRRLAQRLRALGVHDAVEARAPQEHVRIALDVAAAMVPGQATRFGVGGGAVHPATGYALARILDDAPVVARAIGEALTARRTPADIARAAWRAQWTASRRASRRLLEHGRDVLLSLDGDGLRAFFGAFFRLDQERQRAFLTSTSRPLDVAWSMAGMWGALPWSLRRSAVLGGRAPHVPSGVPRARAALPRQG